MSLVYVEIDSLPLFVCTILCLLSASVFKWDHFLFFNLLSKEPFFNPSPTLPICYKKSIYSSTLINWDDVLLQRLLIIIIFSIKSSCQKREGFPNIAFSQYINKIYNYIYLSIRSISSFLSFDMHSTLFLTFAMF